MCILNFDRYCQIVPQNGHPDLLLSKRVCSYFTLCYHSSDCYLTRQWQWVWGMLLRLVSPGDLVKMQIRVWEA